MKTYKIERIDDDGMVISSEVLNYKPGRGKREPLGALPEPLRQYLHRQGGTWAVYSIVPMCLGPKSLAIGRSSYLGTFEVQPSGWLRREHA